MEASWRTTFLAVSILSSSCFLQAQAQNSTISITLIPPNPARGQNITLRPDHFPAGLRSCSWYKGLTMSDHILTYCPSPLKYSIGIASSGHRTINEDCSLLICNLSPSDSGNYMLVYKGVGIDQLGTTSFKVLESEGSQTEQSSWVVFGPLLALTLLGALFGILFWIHHLRNKRSIEVQPADPLYCNISISGQKNARRSSNQTNLYEDLQFGDQAIYEQLKK